MFISKYLVYSCTLAALLVVALPLKDIEIVESTIREVRADVPEDLHLAESSYGHNYAAHDDDAVGYLKRTADGGSDGYKHFDSYHKKDGDKYGYEKHTSFGKADNAKYDAGFHDGDNEKSGYKAAEEVAGEEGDNYEPLEKYTEGGTTGERNDFGVESAKYFSGHDVHDDY